MFVLRTFFCFELKSASKLLAWIDIIFSIIIIFAYCCVLFGLDEIVDAHLERAKLDDEYFKDIPNPSRADLKKYISYIAFGKCIHEIRL